MFVLFSCKGCGLKDKKVVVQARKANEGLSDWMTYVQQTVGRDHQIHSPRCRSGVCDLKIPVGTDGGDEVRVGGEPHGVTEPEGD